jgi:hypothetical protein
MHATNRMPTQASNLPTVRRGGTRAVQIIAHRTLARVLSRFPTKFEPSRVA